MAFCKDLSSFEECLKGYLIQSKLLNEQLKITVTNQQKLQINGFWTTVMRILLGNFFSNNQHTNVKYDAMVLNIDKPILEEATHLFGWLISEKLYEGDENEKAFNDFK